MTALTNEYTKRVNTEIVRTQKILNNELSFSIDLRNNSKISELEAHIIHLNNMIENGWNAPKFN